LRPIKAGRRDIGHALCIKERRSEMVQSIMVPVDLAHKGQLGAAVAAAVQLAKADRAKLTLAGVTGSAPGEAARSPAEFARKLAEFAAEVSDQAGIPVASRPLVDVDVAADLGGLLIKAAEDTGVDLIVMASHVPGVMEHIFASNAGYVASHAKCSVYVVR
jgi:nucleotide-binding universal stress UspA family protein